MRWLLAIATLLSFGPVLAVNAPAVPFVENKGQWPEHVLYRALVPGGALFVERDALTYVLRQGGPMHHHGQADLVEDPGPARMHAYRVTFVGGRPGTGVGREALPHYENHFVGADPAHWGTACAVFPEVVVRGIYPGIDLRLDGRSGLKYDLLVAPGVDPSVVRMRFEGQDALGLENGRLLVTTTAGVVIEEAPVSYQGTDRKLVPSSYRLTRDVVSFAFAGPLDHALPLVIDPVLTFSTYSGSNADNFGFTATYDDDGNLYGGGIAFNFGYPTTTGVLQGAIAGGTIDIAITKFSPDGTALVWSTYLGGAANESPHSLVVNDNDELYVLGTSGSADFPTTAGCFDNTFGAGPALNFGIGYGYSHANGTDIIVSHFNAAATALIGSTYVGGSQADGLNNDAALANNYGDSFRGEIALDAQQRPVIATSTQSPDIPVSPGAPQPLYGGGAQDGYIFRMDPGLTTLQFATFLGGTNADSGYGVQFDGAGNVYVTGGTMSGDLPMAGSPLNGGALGGVDGYIAKFSPAGNTLLATTYLGTAGYDQSYLIQLNTADEVYVVGQSEGGYPTTPGKYGNAGSAQFIHKVSNDLSTSLWSTVIGTGNGTVDISPSAFLVSDCGQIYLSGWGGTTNFNANAPFSTTTGLPVTADAFQPVTNGSDFYLMVLQPDATGLAYATFFGGATSHEHVDGGTSRFDKNGSVYQAVCAGCGGNDDFPSTPGAWSPINNSFNCNLGVFKFDLTLNQAVIDIAGPSYVCLPDQAEFLNLSVGGSSQFWDFGDNTTSTLFEPTHTYTDTGTYVVTMVLLDTNICVPNDTAYLTITVLDPLDARIDPVDTLCPGANVQLQALGGYAYAWLPDPTLSDTSIANPIASPVGNTTYTVIVTDSCGTDTATVDVVVQIPSVQAGPDTLVCAGSPVPLTASAGIAYSWSPAALLDDPFSQTPIATPTDTTWFYVEVTIAGGCTGTDSVLVLVETTPPVTTLNDAAVCEGGSVQLQAGGGTSYAWQPAAGITDLTVPDPVVSPPQTMYYYVLVSNSCGGTPDSALVSVETVQAQAWPDTIICPGESVVLNASGGVGYLWSPTASLSDPASQNPVATPSGNTVYRVIVNSAAGCLDTAYVNVDLFPPPFVDAGNDVTVEFGDAAQLLAVGNGVITWTNDITLSCTDCPDPIARTETTTTYFVQLVDTNGCVATDQVTVFVEGTIYVPNTFTPDGDGINDAFRVLATEIKEFRMIIFNRWGEEIYRTASLQNSWDGTYNGVRSPIDTYVWRVDLTEESGEKRTLYGHVNLIR